METNFLKSEDSFNYTLIYIKLDKYFVHEILNYKYTNIFQMKLLKFKIWVVKVWQKKHQNQIKKSKEEQNNNYNNRDYIWSWKFRKWVMNDMIPNTD